MTLDSHTDHTLRIGILALQGDFQEHAQVLQRLDQMEIVEVRLPEQLEGLDGIIIPGGETTTISKLMREYKLVEPLRAFAKAGKAVWGTCAGMIVIAKEATDLDAKTKPLGLVDISVRRNAYGRQLDSFEEDLAVSELDDDQPFHCVFIRAPGIDKTGKKVQVLATLPDGSPVAARQGHVLVTAFHPELTDDVRFHSLFLRMVGESRRNGKRSS